MLSSKTLKRLSIITTQNKYKKSIFICDTPCQKQRYCTFYESRVSSIFVLHAVCWKSEMVWCKIRDFMKVWRYEFIEYYENKNKIKYSMSQCKMCSIFALDMGCHKCRLWGARSDTFECYLSTGSCKYSNFYLVIN